MNAQALFRLIRNNEAAENFDLGQWVCGTYGCLVGNDLLACGFEPRAFHCMRFTEAGDFYGISALMASFLFGRHEVDRGSSGIAVADYGNGEMVISAHDMGESLRDRNIEDKDAAISRVRKYLYYKLHKAEMEYDDRGCVRESIRRAEGDHHVLRAVKSAVERKERETTNAWDDRTSMVDVSRM